MPLNRRDLARFAGGSALGVLFSPLPWKLLDDSAIWTQNWSLTPKLPQGEVTTRFTTCTLCPEACGVRARSVGGVPFALAGVPAHPTGYGALCPAGVGGHAVAYQPGRVRHVMRRGSPARLGDALAAIRSAKGPIAILDERPGRAISAAYRDFAAAAGGMYLTLAPRQEATLETVRRLVEGAPAAYGIDLEHTRTVLSFGAPILDGWGAPGRVWSARGGFHLIQAEPRQSRTAALADRWLPIRPGTEAALALGIAHVMLRDGLAQQDVSRAPDFAQYRALVALFTPDAVGSITGLPPAHIIDAARAFAGGTPALAIGGGDPGGGPLGAEEEIAIAGLNLLAGSVGRRGGLLARRGTWRTDGTPFSEVAAGAIGALIIDAAPSGNVTPWELLKAKLAPGAVVVSLAAFDDGDAGHADFLVPVPAHLESLEDAPAPFDAPFEMFSVSQPLLTAPHGVGERSEFLAALAGALGVARPAAATDMVRQRAAQVHALRRGAVFSYADGSSKPVSAIGSAEQFWTALTEGACWIDEPPGEDPPRHFRLLGGGDDAAERLATAARGRLKADPEYPLTLIPYGWSGTVAGGSGPLATKLYQESGLRSSANEAALAPETARAHGLDDGCAATIETRCGACRVRVRVSDHVKPGLVEVAVAPLPRGNALDVCTTRDCTWRISTARIRRTA
jgi:anaerobic selenocysteine-containing dehydrogenase